MKLQEIFDQLTAGELSQISVGGEGQGVINSKNHKILVNHINLALANLFQRFTLKQGKATLALIPNQTEYTITEPDFAKILSVKTGDGYELGLNDRKDEYSCSTYKLDVLTVPLAIVNGDSDLPECYKTLILDVAYRATHPKFDASEDGDIDPDVLQVDMPYPYLEPLLYFVASRCYHPMSLNSEINMGSSYAAKYEQACQRLEMSNLTIDQGAGNDRLYRNGWV